MKIRLTLMTSNNRPVSALGSHAEEKIRLAWEMVLAPLRGGADEDDVYVEKVEIVDEEETK